MGGRDQPCWNLYLPFTPGPQVAQPGGWACVPEEGHTCAELQGFRWLVGGQFQVGGLSIGGRCIVLFSLFWSMPELMLIASQLQERISGLEALPSEALL